MIIIALIKRRQINYLLYENCMLLYLKKIWITFTQGYFLPNFGWNWSSGSGIEDFLILLFLNYLPLEIDTSFQETWIHFIQGCMVPGLVEIGPVLLEKKILNFANVLLLFLNYLPLQIEQGSSFEHTWIPFTKGCIVPSLVRIGPFVPEKKIFNFRQCIFDNSWLSSVGKGQGPSFEQTRIQFGWNWPSVSR